MKLKCKLFGCSYKNIQKELPYGEIRKLVCNKCRQIIQQCKSCKSLKCDCKEEENSYYMN
mgnify:CR=1 FL=1